MAEQLQNYAQSLEQNWDIYWAEKQAKFDGKLSSLDLNTQIERLNALVESLTKPENITSEDEKKTLAQAAMIKAANEFLGRITGLLTEFNDTQSSTRKPEIADEIFEACEKYQREIDKLAPLADPDNYNAYVAIVILTVLTTHLLLLTINISILIALTHFSPAFAASPIFDILIAAQVYFFLTSDFTNSIRLLETFNLLDGSKSTYPIPGTERWNNIWNNISKEWFSFSNEMQKEQKYYADLIPNMFANVISKIMRFFFGDSGNFVEERKTGYDIAKQIKSTLTEVSADNPERMASPEKVGLYAYDSVFASSDKEDKPEPTKNSNALQQFFNINFLNVIK